ncbi:hypothetical protein EUGRSUZ_H04106 [Eucalyptus grandis]|uniref:Uncharacterized protein n=2 Tax=Eucalyptus grandis TaxID=71139 RepID=A0ACC3JVS3_EUCGR|nr:hypothetical protein EUGRSUZ_H04106 [Eucalyptus grandis]
MVLAHALRAKFRSCLEHFPLQSRAKEERKKAKPNRRTPSPRSEARGEILRPPPSPSSDGRRVQPLHHQQIRRLDLLQGRRFRCLRCQDYGSSGRMDTNDSLRVASLWHSMHAISQQLSPTVGCSGIELLEADTFDLHCFQSLTGTKFFVVCEPGTQHMEALLKVIYELYTDYVLKNPFYEMEMPIRCELFDLNLSQAVQKDRVALLGR